MIEQTNSGVLLPDTIYWVFAGILTVYALALLVVGYVAQRKIHNVEDYVLAGRQLRTGLATITMIATWFGAESLMTTTDQVASVGLSGAMLDPIGISVCLLIAGVFVAGPLWRMSLLTIPDFFRVRYGPAAEFASACILVPSYFGWIAAQYLALAVLLEQFFGVPQLVGVIGVAVLATSYSLMGGMWSVTWTDAIQMVLIVLGLFVMAVEILRQTGLGESVTNAPWHFATDASAQAMVMGALSALVIGSLGNLPVQDLMQRISSANSDRTASRACVLAAVGYLAMGSLPILAGLSAGQLLPEVPSEGVLTALAQRLLSPALLLIFLLAVVSTVLSTVVSAVLAPAAVLSQNLIQPFSRRWSLFESEQARLASQRFSTVVIVVASVALALSGSDAYELVESAYSLSLVGLFAPFIFGLRWKRAPRVAALASMIVGVFSWGVHVSFGWEFFFQPYFQSASASGYYAVLRVFPHELGDTLLSVSVFLILSVVLARKRAAA